MLSTVFLFSTHFFFPPGRASDQRAAPFLAIPSLAYRFRLHHTPQLIRHTDLWPGISFQARLSFGSPSPRALRDGEPLDTGRRFSLLHSLCQSIPFSSPAPPANLQKILHLLASPAHVPPTTVQHVRIGYLILFWVATALHDAMHRLRNATPKLRTCAKKQCPRSRSPFTYVPPFFSDWCYCRFACLGVFKKDTRLEHRIVFRT